MLAPLTSAMAAQLLSPSARVLAASALPATMDPGPLPWAEVHWPTLMSLIAYERAEGPASRLLGRWRALVPDAVLTSAQTLERVAQFRAAELSDAAARAVDALESVGVTALWLKGAALAMQSPAGFGVRSMGDLDVLVAPADLGRAREALASSGWSAPASAGYDVHHHEAPMTRPGGLRLELHTALFPPDHPFSDEAADVWLSRGVQVSWGARRVLVLPREWHVVHAATHWAWSHEGTVGTWQLLHDLHWLTADWPAAGAAWDGVERNADELGATLPVGWAVWTARRLSGLPVSEAVVTRLRGSLGVAGGLVERQWVLAAFHSPAGSPSVRWSRFWWRRAMRGLGDAGGRWPWRAGRGGQGRESADAGTEALPSLGRRWSRWRRHVARVLGS